MIDFYFWTTPNGYKVLQFLVEIGILIGERDEQASHCNCCLARNKRVITTPVLISSSSEISSQL